jgi:hypothetical protein
MKKHLLSLVSPANRLLTLSLLVASILLIIASQVVGITDNLPGILLLFFGMISLFFSFVHPWHNSRNYAWLSIVSVGVGVLTFVMIYTLAALKMEKYISEGVVMITIFLFCVPGIFVGIAGMFLYMNKKN